jgi:hypothetical protein
MEVLADIAVKQSSTNKNLLLILDDYNHRVVTLEVDIVTFAHQTIGMIIPATLNPDVYFLTNINDYKNVADRQAAIRLGQKVQGLELNKLCQLSTIDRLKYVSQFTDVEIIKVVGMFHYRCRIELVGKVVELPNKPYIHLPLNTSKCSGKLSLHKGVLICDKGYEGICVPVTEINFGAQSVTDCREIYDLLIQLIMTPELNKMVSHTDIQELSLLLPKVSTKYYDKINAVLSNYKKIENLSKKDFDLIDKLANDLIPQKDSYNENSTIEIADIWNELSQNGQSILGNIQTNNIPFYQLILESPLYQCERTATIGYQIKDIIGKPNFHQSGLS